jgi:hypothetical protein
VSCTHGRVCGELLSHYDFMPTLLDLLGLEGPADRRLPGRSFAPELAGRPNGGRDRLVVFDEYGPARMIRTRDWKLVRRFPEGADELYDLAADPDEEADLSGRPQHAGTAAELRGELDEWFRQYADPDLDGFRLPVAGSGQADLVGRAGGGRPAFAPPPERVDAAGTPAGRRLSRRRASRGSAPAARVSRPSRAPSRARRGGPRRRRSRRRPDRPD